MDEFKMLWEITKGIRPTCSLDKPIDGGLSFLRNSKYKYLLNDLSNVKDLMVLVPNDFNLVDDVNSEIKLYRVYDVDLMFTLYHNEVYKDFDPSINDIIHKTAVIHSTSVIGVDGVSTVFYGQKRILFKHIGNVVIESGVNISANSVIHRAKLDSTIIGKNTIIGSLTNIGHNTIIGKDCVITTCVSIGGSCKIGNNCMIGMGAVIRNGVNICDNVVIGMGAVVNKNVKVPGVYTGNPLRFVKDRPDGYNFQSK